MVFIAVRETWKQFEKTMVMKVEEGPDSQKTLDELILKLSYHSDATCEGNGGKSCKKWWEGMEVSKFNDQSDVSLSIEDEQVIQSRQNSTSDPNDGQPFVEDNEKKPTIDEKLTSPDIVPGAESSNMESDKSSDLTDLSKPIEENQRLKTMEKSIAISKPGQYCDGNPAEILSDGETFNNADIDGESSALKVRKTSDVCIVSNSMEDKREIQQKKKMILNLSYGKYCDEDNGKVQTNDKDLSFGDGADASNKNFGKSSDQSDVSKHIAERQRQPKQILITTPDTEQYHRWVDEAKLHHDENFNDVDIGNGAKSSNVKSDKSSNTSDILSPIESNQRRQSEQELITGNPEIALQTKNATNGDFTNTTSNEIDKNSEARVHGSKWQTTDYGKVLKKNSSSLENEGDELKSWTRNDTRNYGAKLDVWAIIMILTGLRNIYDTGNKQNQIDARITNE